MPEREYKTRRGELLARLEWSRTGSGQYLIEGYQVTKRDNGYWFIGRVAQGHAATAMTLTDALEYIAVRLETRQS